jgi:hypothetical protein
VPVNHHIEIQAPSLLMEQSLIAVAEKNVYTTCIEIPQVIMI